MDFENIKEIAQDRLMSDLCLKWFLEKDEVKKKVIYEKEIMPLYEKILIIKNLIKSNSPN